MSDRPASASRLAGPAWLLVTSVGWGLNWPAIKFLLQEWPALFARGVSGVSASVLVAVVAVLAGHSLRVPRAAHGRLAAGAFFNVFAWMGFGTLAMQWLPVGQAALLVYTMPAWTTLLAWWILGARPSPRGVAGLLLCLVGVCLLLGVRPAAPASAHLLGVAFALGAAVLFALGTLTVAPPALPPLVVLAWQLALGSVPMIVVSLLSEAPHGMALSDRAFAVLVYMTVVPMGLCYFAWFAALRLVRPQVATITTLLTPVVGILSAAALLGEPLGIREIAAMVLVLAGVALAMRASPGGAR